MPSITCGACANAPITLPNGHLLHVNDPKDAAGWKLAQDAWEHHRQTIPHKLNRTAMWMRRAGFKVLSSMGRANAPFILRVCYAAGIAPRSRCTSSMAERNDPERLWFREWVLHLVMLGATPGQRMTAGEANIRAGMLHYCVHDRELRAAWEALGRVNPEAVSDWCAMVVHQRGGEWASIKPGDRL